MSETPRPSLKLTLGKKKAPEEKPKPQKAPAPAPATPSSEPRKLTLKIARKTKENNDEEKPKKKPSKKRPVEAPGLHEPTAVAPSSAGPKRLKLNPSKKPGVQSIRIKNKGLVPTRPVGVGYDSEASDNEADPAIEEQFILRMLPGPDCDYLRKAVEERLFDRSEFCFKPLTREGRRAVIKIRDKQYAAALVDLPCIVEGMKSWDRRGWYKSADICQMLLVLGLVANDKEALEYPIPSDVEQLDEKTLRYPHGLTPPLRWARKRRFRNRVSTRTIEQVENAVSDLIEQDEASVAPPRYELVDSASLNRAEGLVQSGDYYEDEYYDDEQDAEGEVDEGMPGMTDRGVYEAGTPTVPKPQSPAAESSGDESEMSEGDEEDVPEEEMDEEQLEQQRQFQQRREEIAELEALIRLETVKWEQMMNQILKNKLAKRIQDLKKDLSLRKVAIGEGDDMD
ncbi:transcription initiation factor TFIID subunit 7 family protein [Aspergillus glaucus CBS 516.65]|uniref:TAFII55 protein conserved region domain-containing protein n=1 Tax=Aspergillus glaucus CBS 516.65 TaxID=1160497 RepID=A0A1L9VKY5_ASPGL|nr:hypothetical protein ASPGLDRAFT_125671 [Aspergillus glaucus CBS 516.65]OJJ84554.1 hypothetical protein ASPGLDRAFT_125671 [Aspergillus glaucus CBS 516.65]